MRLRSGDEDGHVINFSLLNQTFARCSTVEWACSMRWCVALHKDYLLPECWAFAAVPRNTLYWRKFRYVSEFIFTSSGTLSGPTNSLPIIPAQNMTPPPPCCRLTLDGLLQPFIANLCTSHLICEKNGLEVSLDTFWPIQVADFCAWWLREGEYSVRQACQLCLGVRQLRIPMTPACSNICLLRATFLQILV